MEQSENREVQKMTLELLEIFIKICEQYHLRWYFVGGSLIGVLRHQGYIPWDDDIDIGMPRPDYEKFLRLSRKVLPDGYAISNYKTDPKWCFNMSQMIDKKSVIDIYLAEKPRRCHIWIDLFPLDGLPNKKVQRWLHVKRILLYRYLIQIAHIETQVDAQRVGRPWYEKVILKALQIVPLGKLLNTEKLLKKMERYLKKYPYDHSKYVGNMLSRYREKEVFPKFYYGKAKIMPFENINVYVPAKSHKMQKIIYGDYMKLPPVEARESHRIKVIKERKHGQ